jgi:hypothetical protein
LRRTQDTIRTNAPDRTPWLTFVLNALQRQMRRLREKLPRAGFGLVILLKRCAVLAISVLPARTRPQKSPSLEAPP